MECCPELDGGLGVVAILGSIPPLVLLGLFLEKKDVECVGSFDELDVLAVIEGALDSPMGVLLLLSSFSGCFVARKPNVPREAIVAAGVAR